MNRAAYKEGQRVAKIHAEVFGGTESDAGVRIRAQHYANGEWDVPERVARAGFIAGYRSNKSYRNLPPLQPIVKPLRKGRR